MSTDPQIITKRPWYYSLVVIVPLLFLCFPLGLILMWAGKRLSLASRIIITICLIMIFMLGVSNKRSAQQQVSEAPAVKVEPEKERTVNKGDLFKLGDFSYRIKKIETRASVGNSFMNHKAQDGAILVLVHYDILNDSNETKTVMTDDFKLRDAKQRSFQPSTDAGTAYMLGGGKKDFILSEVQPGLKREMTSIFELPKDSISTKGLKLVVPEKGWGSGEIVIPLN